MRKVTSLYTLDKITIESKCYFGEGQWEYEGEVDEEGTACGEGIAIKTGAEKLVYKGMFLGNLPHGIGEQSISN